MKKNKTKVLTVKCSSKKEKWSGSSRYETSPQGEENGATSTEAYRAAIMKCVVYTLLSPISEWFQVYTRLPKILGIRCKDELGRSIGQSMHWERG